MTNVYVATTNVYLGDTKVYVSEIKFFNCIIRFSMSTSKRAASKSVAEEVKTDGGATPYIELDDVMAALAAMIDYLRAFPDAELTDVERRRLMSSGTRRYGFIDAAGDLAEANPQYYPLGFNSEEMKSTIRDIELYRNILQRIREVDRIVSNLLFSRSDEAFRMSLLFYNNVSMLARTGDAGARSIFNILQPFFRRRRPTAGEPTEAQILRDVKAGMKGTKDVDIHIEHESPKMTGGVHVVSNNVHKAKAGFKATESGEIVE